ncbi:MAG: MFS transporter [Granulosicoccus sp.]
MLSLPANPVYRRLFAAQIISLLGSGLATVALGLLAWRLAGDDAGTVLGVLLAIKMIAYVTVAPVASAFVDRVPRRSLMISLDIFRAAVALALPFVSAVWQIYALIFLLQAASAVFTPTFQATIPDVLPDEEEYTQALSLSRLAYDVESLASPLFAAALMSVVSFPFLFTGTVIGFLVSAVLVLSVTLPVPSPTVARTVWERTTRGMRLYLATPRLRGLLALSLSVSAAGAMVIVNTVVIVRGHLSLGESEVALVLAAFGGGSMFAALFLPKLLKRIGDRPAMLSGASILVAGMLMGPVINTLPVLIILWSLIGLGYSLTQTPAGRLLKRSADAPDRPALFAAQFALSHACWLITYPLAGYAGALLGLNITFLVMAVLSGLGVLMAIQLWPSEASELGVSAHDHFDLQRDHSHIPEFGDKEHARELTVDELHRHQR